VHIFLFTYLFNHLFVVDLHCHHLFFMDGDAFGAFLDY